MKHISAVVLTVVVAVPLMLILASFPVRAAIQYTTYPNASTSQTYQTYPVPHGPVTPASAYGAQIYGDGEYYWLESDINASRWVRTNTFITQSTLFTLFPNDNCTIIHVEVNAVLIAPVQWMLYEPYISSTPNMALAYSINNKATWTHSGVIPAATPSTADWSAPPLSYHNVSCTFEWDVTNLTTWTPAILKSASTWLEIDADLAPYRSSYLDYLGFYYAWIYPGESGEWAGNETEPAPPTGTPYGGNMVTGLSALAGFIGLFCVPALTVVLFRRMDDGVSRIKLIMGSALLMVVFFAFMLFGINT